MKLTFVDWSVMLIYFVFVLGIGFALKRLKTVQGGGIIRDVEGISGSGGSFARCKKWVTPSSYDESKLVPDDRRFAITNRTSDTASLRAIIDAGTCRRHNGWPVCGKGR